MSRVQEWNYAHDAEISFGDVHVSKAPKIALVISIISIITLSVLGIIYKDILEDLIMNPQVTLTAYEVNFEIYDEFDPNDYISSVNVGKYEITNIDNKVDVNTLGDYTVTYSSKNSMNTYSQDLLVHVVDHTDPVILLNTYREDLPITFNNGQYYANVLIGSEVATTFNPENYIDLIIDNYSSLDKIKYEYSNKLDFDKKGDITLVYSATDENGNTGNTTLNISVVEQLDKERIEYQAIIDKMEKELSEYLESHKNE